MENNRIQRLFIKLYKPIISLSEEFDDNKKYILVGNHISKYDPLLLSIVNNDIKFILPVDNLIYHNLNRTIVDLSGDDIDELRSGFVETIDNHISCVFPLNSNNEMEDNNYLELLKRGKMLIMPFGIKGSYKLRDNIYLSIGHSFSPEETNIKEKINREVKKLMQ